MELIVVPCLVKSQLVHLSIVAGDQFFAGKFQIFDCQKSYFSQIRE
jgi:hypothetical protein